MESLGFISFCIVLFYILYDTEALPEYARLFRLKFFQYEEYFKERNTSFPVENYPRFLLKHYPNFATTLFECYSCLTVWFVLFFSVITNNWRFSCLNIIIIWLGYPLLTYLLKKFNE
jgi:hypothetical protein